MSGNAKELAAGSPFTFNRATPEKQFPGCLAAAFKETFLSIQAKDLCHTVKSHFVASSATNSGYIDSKGSVVWGSYPILAYHCLKNSSGGE